jgi:Protein of unknown function (DUF3644)
MDKTIFIQKCSDKFSGKKLDLIKFIGEFEPCSIPALIDLLAEKRRDFKNPHFINKLTKDLEENELIIASDQACSFTHKRTKRPKVFELAKSFPDKLKKKPSKTTKEMIQSSLDSALLAIESFNKPNTNFKTENFIILMINAWLKILHAYLNHALKGSHRESSIDKTLKRRKTLSFRRSLDMVFEKGLISKPAKANLEFCAELRDQIEHSYIRSKYIDAEYCGRFQYMVNNYEAFIKDNFGQEYLENHRLTFALQFSSIYLSPEQKQRIKHELSNDAKSLLSHLNDYEKLATRDLDPDDLRRYPLSVGIYLNRVSSPSKADAIINIIQAGISDQECDDVLNMLQTPLEREGWKPQRIVDEVNNGLAENKHIHLSHLHPISIVFRVKPDCKKNKQMAKEQTIKKFCFWHKYTENYLYTQEYISFLINLFSNDLINYKKVYLLYRQGKYLNYQEYEIQ